jgi:hypothetical protein
VATAHHAEVCRSKAKSGTTHFFTYATAYAVVRGRRYTLALCRMRAKQRMGHVVRTLLARVVTLGIRIKLVLLDRGFYSVRVMRDLITCALPFVMPAVKRGKKPATPGGPTGTYALAAAKQSRWTSYTLTSAHEGRVDFDLAVVCHNTPPGASRIVPGAGFARPIEGDLALRRPIGKCTKPAFARVAATRCCGCCLSLSP